MAEEGTQVLPIVRETVLKKRKVNEDWATTRTTPRRVLTTDARPRGTHGPTGEPEMPCGRIDKMKFGDRAVQTSPLELQERLTKSRKKKGCGASARADADDLPRRDAKRTCHAATPASQQLPNQSPFPFLRRRLPTVQQAPPPEAAHAAAPLAPSRPPSTRPTKAMANLGGGRKKKERDAAAAGADLDVLLPKRRHRAAAVADNAGDPAGAPSVQDEDDEESDFDQQNQSPPFLRCQQPIEQVPPPEAAHTAAPSAPSRSPSTRPTKAIANLGGGRKKKERAAAAPAGADPDAPPCDSRVLKCYENMAITELRKILARRIKHFKTKGNGKKAIALMLSKTVPLIDLNQKELRACCASNEVTARGTNVEIVKALLDSKTSQRKAIMVNEDLGKEVERDLESKYKEISNLQQEKFALCRRSSQLQLRSRSFYRSVWMKLTSYERNYTIQYWN